MESEAARRTDLIDLLKKYWDSRNQDVPFPFTAADGKAVAKFLKDHPEWGREIWLQALRNRYRSEVVHTQHIHTWIHRLGDFIHTPISQFGKPMLNGGGKNGEAATTAQRNREAVERAVANA